MEQINLKISILRPVQRVWEMFTEPAHITKWNFASPEWVCPHAESDFRVGGAFSYRMETKDGSFGFDYAGVFREIIPLQSIHYQLNDGRNVNISFHAIDEGQTEISLSFEPETATPAATQRDGWDKILHNFEKYAENND